MRHLYLTRGRAPIVSRSSEAPSNAIARAVSLTAIVVSIFALAVASPLWAQQQSAQSSKLTTKRVPRQSARQASAQSPTQVAQQQPSAESAVPVSNDSYNLTAATILRRAPSSVAMGQLQKSTNVEVLAHDRGWSRVRIEGWVPDSLLTPADTTYRSNLSAADLRADPDAARGKMVVWNVEFLALQTADPLRHGLADEEPYILARGPNSENALLYLVVPPSLMGTARALQPLAKISVTARVRDGRSDPVGIPILDIQTLRRLR
jgi:hypothetical protein